jgi:peptide/nickel transport system ATP-binding protein
MSRNPLHPYAKGLMGAILHWRAGTSSWCKSGLMPRLSAIPPSLSFNRAALAFDLPHRRPDQSGTRDRPRHLYDASARTARHEPSTSKTCAVSSTSRSRG